MPTLAVAETRNDVEHDRFLQRRDDALGDLDRVVGVGERVHQHRELVAAEPGRGVARAQAARRVARSRSASSASPAECPRLSFTVLKSSRSMNSTASCPPLRWRRVAAWSTRSRNSAWLASPVSGSWNAWCVELVLEAAVLGDVAEAPHAADDLAVDALRQRVALEDAPVLELEDVVTVRLGLVVQALDLGRRTRGIAELLEHERERAAVVARLEHFGGMLPHLGEAAVPARDAAGAVDHEDAVGGRLERRRQHGVRVAQVGSRRRRGR